MADVQITFVPTPEGTNLTEVLTEFLGVEDPAVLDYLSRLVEEEPEALKFLVASSENARAFARDPVGVLREQFPQIQPPSQGQPPRLPAKIAVDVLLPLRDTLALNLVERLWQHLAVSEANTQAFVQSPFSVITSVGANDPPDVVDRVVRAIDTALGGNRLPVSPVGVFEGPIIPS